MAQNTDATDAPTATEFIPANKIPVPRSRDCAQVRGLQRVQNGKGLELVYHESYDDEVESHIFVCDQCGQVDDTESGIELHLRTEHEN